MISGKFRNKFKYANMACMVDIPVEDSKDFEIISIEGNQITLVSCWDGEKLTKEIQFNRDGSEYFIVDNIGVYEWMIKNGKASQVKCEPFLDSAKHPFIPEEQPEQKIKPLFSKKQKEKLLDSSNWHATCSECGCKKMEYTASTFTYHCPKCGNILEV